MSESPLSDPGLLAVVCGMAGTIGGICVWIYQHTRNCHRGKSPAQVEHAEHEAAARAKRDTHIDEELSRLDEEIGHASKPGTILGRMHRNSRSIREIRTTLGMPPDPPP